jgi:uncharacterized protein
LHEATTLIEIAWIAASLAAAGLLMGFLAGLLGIGGGAILVPILYEIFSVLGVDPSVRLHLSIGTGLAAMVPTTLRSFQSHLRTGTVDTQFVRSLTVPVVSGVVIGSLVARIAAQDVLAALWAACAALLALRLLLGREDWQLGHKVPGNPIRAVFGVVVGLFSTLMSIGGAAFVTAFLTLYGRKIHQAVATSTGIGPMIAIPGTLGFIWAGWGNPDTPFGSLGYVNLLGAAVVVPLGIAMVPLGARISHRLPRRRLELFVATLLGIISVRFLLLAL